MDRMFDFNGSKGRAETGARQLPTDPGQVVGYHRAEHAPAMRQPCACPWPLSLAWLGELPIPILHVYTQKIGRGGGLWLLGVGR
jgi:hypothetical protein